MAGSDIFISYAHADEALASTLESMLREQGISVWRDKTSLLAGDKWPMQLGEAISQSHLFVLLWSEKAKNSSHVTSEWCIAFAQHKRIIPVLVDSTSLHPTLQKDHGLSSKNLVDAVVALQRALADSKIASGPALVPSESQQEKDRELITWLGGIPADKPGAVAQALRKYVGLQPDPHPISITWWISAALVLVMAALAFPFSGRRLKGQVELEQADLTRTNGTHLPVGLKTAEEKDATDENGLFGLKLPRELTAGKEAEFLVQKQGWRIVEPPNGRQVIPSDDALRTEVIHLVLAPSKPEEFWSKERRRKCADLTNNRFGSLLQGGTKREDIRPEQLLSDCARRFWHTPQDLQHEILRWREYGSDDDGSTMTLVGLIEKKFDETRTALDKLAARNSRELEEAPKTSTVAAQLREDAINSSRLAGDASFNLKDFPNALAQYERALRLVSPKENPSLWASILADVATARVQRGLRSNTTQQDLETALSEYKQALEVLSPESQADDWAQAMHNQGAALVEQALRTEEERRDQLLANAIDNYEQALKIRTREKAPLKWAMTLSNLGGVFAQRAQRAGCTTDGDQWRKKAEGAYQKALKERTLTMASVPVEWAMTASNLATVYVEQGICAKGQESLTLFKQAVEMNRKALAVLTQEQLPYEWAQAQHNLGGALLELGARVDGGEGTKLLEDATTAYRSALAERSADELPHDRLLTQNALGRALLQLARRTIGEERKHLAQQAVAAHQEALRLAQFPGDKASTQSTLAKAQFKLAEACEALEEWQCAATNYDQAAGPNMEVENAYRNAAHLYHDRLFESHKAQDLHQRWLAQHEDDLQASVSLVETLITTRKFDQAEKLVQELLPRSEQHLASQISLRVLRITTLAALGKRHPIPEELNKLREAITKLPQDGSAGWNFGGLKHFTRQEKTLVASRRWLVMLLSAVEASKQSDMRAGVNQAIVQCAKH